MLPIFWKNWLFNLYERVKNDPRFRGITNPPGKKVAVIIEPRNMPELRYVLYNFAYLLLPCGWHFQIFHGNQNQEEVTRLQQEMYPNVSLTHLQVDNLDESQYNRLLTSLTFYESLVGNPTHLLVFQTDCLLLNDNLEPFLQYDMVGAPWIHDARGCNGGFSLRRVDAMIRILKNNPWVYDNEDGFFSHRYGYQLYLPDRETLAKFSMETIWSDHPVGLHKAYAHQPHDKLYALLEKTAFEWFQPLSFLSLLESIQELGYLQRGGRVYLPKQPIHHERWMALEKFLIDTGYRNTVDAYFTLFDGWREHTEPCENPVFIKVTEGNRGMLSYFQNKGSAGEGGRFIPPREQFPESVFPVLDKRVISFGRHTNDPTVWLVPDPDFIKSHGYLGLKAEIDRDDIRWEDKKNIVYWRGGNHGIPYKKYQKAKSQQSHRSQRELLIRGTEGWLDAKPSYTTTKKEMLQYKYLVDVDGEVNAWSSLWWKLYSRSVVFKVESHYEQWYYRDLVAWVHYIPVKGNLEDLETRYRWALANEEKCREIAAAGREFTRLRTYEYVVNNYKIS